MTPESNTDQLSTEVSGRLHKFVMPEPYAAYLALKHLQPDVVREIRLSMDNGTEPEEAFQDKPKALQAIKYMRDNPLTGVVSKWEGQNYIFEA